MQKRVFIIHGWDGYPDEGCFPWLKKELEARGFQVFVPSMPTPLFPKIETWVSFLNEQVGTPDENTFLFGHSIGAQTILRYLASLDDESRVGGVVFMAGWLGLTEDAYEDDDDRKIAKDWLEKPIVWAKVKPKSPKFIALFSDNDYLVPIHDSKIFEKKLGAKIVIDHDKGHFSGSDGIKELPSALFAILEVAGL